MRYFIERVRWWIYHPRFELIYLLGGIPREHNGGVLHYRNIESVVWNLKMNIARANGEQLGGDITKGD